MTNAIVRIADVTGFSRNQIELIKETVARGSSDDELMLFLHLAKRSGLDPFSRQIYLIERRTQVDGQWKTTRQPQTGIDGLRLTADRTGNYAPGRAPTFEYDADGHLFSATAYVCKFVRDGWREVAATAHYREYVQTKRDGAPNSMWADKPHIMLAKCAEALALRRAFPADLSGLYTADEMRDDTMAPAMSAQPVIIDAKVKTESQAQDYARTFEGEAIGVQAAFNGGGALSIKLAVQGQTCLYHNAPAETIHLADGDPVIVTGELRTYKGDVVLWVSSLTHATNPETWAMRAANAAMADDEVPLFKDA